MCGRQVCKLKAQGYRAQHQMFAWQMLSDVADSRQLAGPCCRAIAGELLRCHAHIEKQRLVVRAGAVVVLKGHVAGGAIGRILVEPELPECLRCAEGTDSKSSKSAMASCA